MSINIRETLIWRAVIMVKDGLLKHSLLVNALSISSTHQNNGLLGPQLQPL